MYTDAYWAWLAIYPDGWVPDNCDLYPDDPGTTCDTVLNPMYLYPDGTWGPCPWYPDSTLPQGWSTTTDCNDWEGF